MRLRLTLLVLLFLCTFAGVAAAETQHVLVIDQSGSMEPFMHAADKRLHRVLEQMIGADSVFGDRDRIAILLFSQPGAAMPSPVTLFQGTAGDLRKGWSGLSGRLDSVPQWTDLMHGLREGVKVARAAQGAAPRIIWFLTDNVNEGSDKESREGTTAFYQALKESPDFQAFSDIQVYPVDLQHPTAKVGHMLYAMLWVPPGTPADEAARQVQAYRQVTESFSALNLPEFMGQPPLLVKPLDADPLRLEITEFVPEKGKPVAVKVENGVVALPNHLFSEGKPIRGTLRGRLVSNYETFRIPRVQLKAALSDPQTIDFKPVKPGLQKIDPADLGEIAAKSASQPFEVRVELPPLAADWNMQSVLTGTSGKVTTDLKLQATFPAGSGLEIDTGRFSHVTFHAMTELPKLFARDVRVLPVAVTLSIPVDYSATRFWLGLAAMVGGIVLAGLLGVWLVRFFTYREIWEMTTPDGSTTALVFRKLFSGKQPVTHGSHLVGWLARVSDNTLRFTPEGEGEAVPLEGSSSFTAQTDSGIAVFYLEPKSLNDTGGEDDVA